MTTKLFEPWLDNRSGLGTVSPAKVPLRTYVPGTSPGVMVHEAVPELLVVASQDSVALSVRVTGSPEIGADVFELVSTPVTVVATLYSPVAALTFKVVGMGGGALTVTLEEALEER